MSVRKIRNTWWVDFSHNKRRNRRKSPDNTKGGAQSYELLLRSKIAKGEPIDKEEKEDDKISFKDFTERWFKVYVKSNNKPSEIKQKEYILKKHLLPFFGKFILSSITNFKIEDYKAYKVEEKKLALKTINNHLAILSKCFHTAEEWGLIEKIPKIRLFKLPPQPFDFLSVVESKKLIDSADDVWKDMIIIALKTGLRRGELLALHWDDINLDSGKLTVRRSLVNNMLVSPKNNTFRNIPLTNFALKVLSEMKTKEGFVFSNGDEKPLEFKKAHRALDAIAEKAGIRKISWHVLRHTFASHLAEKGVPMKFIQELLGHSEIKMTMRYAHLSPSVLNESIQILDSNNSRHCTVNTKEVLLDKPKLVTISEASLLPKVK